MKRTIPLALTTLRLLLGPAALLCALRGAPTIVYLPMVIAATLSDIFDGILARRWGVATPALRRYDSIADVVYYLFLLRVVWILRAPEVLANIAAIALILISELAVIGVSWAKFRRYPATHSYLAKFYGLCLLAALIAVLVFGVTGWPLKALALVAVLTNAEIIAIHFLMDSPPMDVRSLVDVMRAPQ